MAQKKGMTVKMDNSDDDQRKYDIACEVAVADGQATDMRSITVNKDGKQVAYGSITGMAGGTPNTSVNVYGLPVTEHIGCLKAVYGFAELAAIEAVNE